MCVCVGVCWWVSQPVVKSLSSGRPTGDFVSGTVNGRVPPGAIQARLAQARVAASEPDARTYAAVFAGGRGGGGADRKR